MTLHCSPFISSLHPPVPPSTTPSYFYFSMYFKVICGHFLLLLESSDISVLFLKFLTSSLLPAFTPDFSWSRSAAGGVETLSSGPGSVTSSRATLSRPFCLTRSRVHTCKRWGLGCMLWITRAATYPAAVHVIASPFRLGGDVPNAQDSRWDLSQVVPLPSKWPHGVCTQESDAEPGP